MNVLSLSNIILLFRTQVIVDKFHYVFSPLKPPRPHYIAMPKSWLSLNPAIRSAIAIHQYVTTCSQWHTINRLEMNQNATVLCNLSDSFSFMKILSPLFFNIRLKIDILQSVSSHQQTMSHPQSCDQIANSDPI